MTRPSRLAASLTVLSLILAVAVAAGAVPALVRTNTDHVLEGSLSGLAPILRLIEPASAVGPAVQYDIPVGDILQIFVDFPRVVVETSDRVFVGPYSAFSGIAQNLRVDQRGMGTELPTTTVQAIALNGQPFRPVPRSWLGRGYLVIEKPSSLEPEVALTPAAPAPVPILASDRDEALAWGDLTPTAPVEETTEGLPWWVGLLVVAGIVALLLLSSSGSA